MMGDVPLTECKQRVDGLKRRNPSVRSYQKFTCAKCGARLMVEEPDTWFLTGHCDKCDHVTNIEAQGCGYMLTFDPGLWRK